MQKIKTGDNVKIMTGKDRGKTGKVIQLLMKNDQSYVVVEGANMMKKHLRSRQGEKGQVIELAAPIHISNVMLIDPKSNKPTRVGVKKDGDKKVRVAKRTGNAIEA